MADEQVQQPQPEKPPEAAPAKKGGMMSYIMLGGGFVVVMVVAIVVTMLLMGGSKQPAASDSGAEAANTQEPAPTPDRPSPRKMATDDSLADSLMDSDPAILDQIKDNLAMLDYKPTEAELAEEESQVSVEDSIQKANWFRKEQARLNKRKDSLDAREKKLVALDQEVSQKITRIEKVQSTRIANLARLYDDMDAEAVAKLMANLDDATVVSILPRMKNKNASAVLALFPAQRAARISKQLITIAGDDQ